MPTARRPAAPPDPSRAARAPHAPVVAPSAPAGGGRARGGRARGGRARGALVRRAAALALGAAPLAPLAALGAQGTAPRPGANAGLPAPPTAPAGSRSTRPAAPGSRPAPAVAPLLAITGVTVIDVANGRRLPDRTVVVRDGRIRIVGPGSGPDALALPPDALVLDGRDRFLVPGLWDAALHLDLGDAGTRAVSLPLLLAHGVTGVRERWTDCVGCRPEPDGRDPLAVRQALRGDVRAGRTAGPRLLYTGAPLDGPGGRDDGLWAVATADEARAAVDTTADRRLDAIGSWPWLGPAAYRAAAAAARTRGLPLVGPAPVAVTLDELRTARHALREGLDEWTVACATVGDSVRLALRAAAAADSAARPGTGQGSLERVREATRPRLLETFDAARCARVLPRLGTAGAQLPRLTHARPGLALRDAADDPSFQYLPAATLRAWRATRADARSDAAAADAARQRAMVGVLAGLGLPMAVGTETFAGANLWGAAVHDEIALLADAGLSPLATLRAATLEPARALGLADSLGTVEPGKVADLLLLDADPLADPANLRRIHAVVAAGRVYDRAALDALLDGARRFANGDSTAVVAIVGPVVPPSATDTNAPASPESPASTSTGGARVATPPSTRPADEGTDGARPTAVASRPPEAASTGSVPRAGAAGATGVPPERTEPTDAGRGDAGAGGGTPPADGPRSRGGRPLPPPVLAAERAPLAAAAPPRARLAVVADTLRGIPLPDPYRWLEDRADPAVARFTGAQGAWATRVLDALADARTSFAATLAATGSPADGGDRAAPPLAIAPAVGRTLVARAEDGGATWDRLTVADTASGVERAVVTRAQLLRERRPVPTAATAAGMLPSPDGQRVAFLAPTPDGRTGELQLADVAARRLLADRLPGVPLEGPAAPDRAASLLGDATIATTGAVAPALAPPGEPTVALPAAWLPDGGALVVARVDPAAAGDAPRLLLHRVGAAPARALPLLGASAAAEPALAAGDRIAPPLSAPGSPWLVVPVRRAAGGAAAPADAPLEAWVAPVAAVTAARSAADARRIPWRRVVAPDDGARALALVGDTLLAIVTRGAPRGRVARRLLAPEDEGNARSAPVAGPWQPVLMEREGILRDLAVARDGLWLVERWLGDDRLLEVRRGERRPISMPPLVAGASTRLAAAPARDGVWAVFRGADGTTRWTRLRPADSTWWRQGPRALVAGADPALEGVTSSPPTTAIRLSFPAVAPPPGTPFRFPVPGEVRLAVTMVGPTETAPAGSPPRISTGFTAPARSTRLPVLLEAAPRDALAAAAGDAIVRAWVAAGGVYVRADVRGSAALGPAWRDARGPAGAVGGPDAAAAADLATVADALVRDGWAPAGVALLGRGGTAQAAALAAVQRPGAFAAVVLDRARPDAARDAQRAADPSGSADGATAEALRSAVRAAPYRRVVGRVRFPAVLVLTPADASAAESTDAAKLVARLQAAQTAPAAERPIVWWRVPGDASSDAVRAAALAFLARGAVAAPAPAAPRGASPAR